MEVFYKKQDLKRMEDRFENVFSLPYETNEMPDHLVEMKEASYPVIHSQLIKKSFSLVVCLPCLPVVKILKKAELPQENHSFRLLRIAAENYHPAIEDFLKETEHAFTYFWLQNFQGVVYELPRTSQERHRLSNLHRNQLDSFWLEVEECTVAVWNRKSGS